MRLHLMLWCGKLFLPSILTSLSLAGTKVLFIRWVEPRSPDPSFTMLTGGGIILCIALLIYGQWLFTLRSLALARMAVFGGISFEDAYKYAWKHKWTAFGLYNAGVLIPLVVLIFWCAVAVGSLFFASAIQGMLLVLSGLILFAIGLGMTLTLAWSILYTSLAFTVLAAEDVSLARLLKRARDLAVPYLWRGGSFVCLLAICLVCVTIALEVPMVVAAIIEVFVRGTPKAQDVYRMPIELQILGTACDTLVSIVVVAVAVQCDALYYNDLRLRLEGSDLLKKLSRFDAEAK